MYLLSHEFHEVESLPLEILEIFKESIVVFFVAFAIYIILSFIEDKVAKVLSNKNKLSPLIGASIGLIPQCGLGVVSADLYHKKHITMGTIIALFIACSDEALPIMLSSGKKSLYVLPLFLSKFVIAFAVGFIVDIIRNKENQKVHIHLHHCEHEEEIHVGCCKHNIEEDHKESKLHHHLIHPVLHSLKIFAYVFAINLVFGVIIYFIGKETLIDVLNSNKYIQPLFAVLIGIIPNCSASVIITEVYLLGGISFGSCLAGLIMNAGLGLACLFKNKENIKNSFVIFAILFATSIIAGYLTCLFTGF